MVAATTLTSLATLVSSGDGGHGGSCLFLPPPTSTKAQRAFLTATSSLFFFVPELGMKMAVEHRQAKGGEDGVASTTTIPRQQRHQGEEVKVPPTQQAAKGGDVEKRNERSWPVKG